MTYKLVNKILLSTIGITLGLAIFNSEKAKAATFDFSNHSSKPSTSFNLNQGNLNLVVTGHSASNGNAKVVKNKFGLGVLGNYNKQVNKDETLIFNFDKTVRIVSATFSKVGLNDNFTLFIDGGEFVSADISGGDAKDRSLGTFNFTSLLPKNQGSEFIFGLADSNDDYFLKKLEVRPVPESSSILGLLAIGVLGASYSLKSKKVSN
jgi:hypothetical protein